MLKTILVATNPLSIYKHPNSRTIHKALSKVNESCRLEDILVSEGNFQTITYTEALQKYNSNYHESEKVYNVLIGLGETRNAIMHFGIDRTDTRDELIICILNSFDIIYNYLYPQLVELDDIGDYFTDDDIVVETIHGAKILFDDNYIYNNIIDFLDELMETSKDHVCALRCSNPESKINEFTELIRLLLEDKKFSQMLTYNHTQIEFRTCDFENNDFFFDITKDSKGWETISSCYSPYFNVTAFCGEAGSIYFLIVHNKRELYIYNQNQCAKWAQHDEAEPDEQWLSDYASGFCRRFNLSKRNLLLAFENMLTNS